MRGPNLPRRTAGRLLLGGLGWIWARGGAVLGAEPSLIADSAALGRMLERARARHGLPGVAAAVVRGGIVTASGVAGVRRKGMEERIEPDDRFHVASCTKGMTATLAAIAVHRGRLDWTSSLAEVLPELAASARAAHRVATLEQLLAHRAKLPAWTQPDARQVEWMKALPGSTGEQRTAFLARVLAAEPPNEGAGDAAYSNVGAVAAGAMVERALGASWEALMASELARPLGLMNLGFGYAATPSSPRQPRGHSQAGELPLDDSRQLATCLWPAGAVHCSIGDLARYAADHLNGLRGRPALLPAALYERMHRPPGKDGEGFTLGWGVRRDPHRGPTHYGAGSGGWFFARIEVMPRLDAAVVVASNSGQAARATREIVEALAESFAAG